MGQLEETPAARKQREREEAKVARDAVKASDIAARFAESSLLKMEPLYLEMQALVAHSSFGQVAHSDPVVPHGMQRRRRVTIRSENLGRPHGPHQEGHSIVQEHALHHR